MTAGPVRVRMGVHTGEPMVTDEGYVGMDVHRAARIAAAGHGGLVLVSKATRDLVGADSLRDLGAHRPKDLAAPERIFQLGDDPFPAPRTLYRTNLPSSLSPRVGRERERELGEAGSLVRSHRMLALTGPGGSGKTRLAIHLAADAAEGVGSDDGLIPYVGGRAMLILLDNFEQVIDAATVVSELIERTPKRRCS